MCDDAEVGSHTGGLLTATRLVLCSSLFTQPEVKERGKNQKEERKQAKALE